MSGGRKREDRIVDPLTHPRSSVCLTVAAEFLGIDKRTLRDRINLKEFPAWRDKKTYRINLSDLIAYKRQGYRRAS